MQRAVIVGMRPSRFMGKELLLERAGGGWHPHWRVNMHGTRVRKWCYL